MDLLHDNGIAVDLGTGTASPPPWLTALHPEMLPVTADGQRRSRPADASTGAPPRRCSAGTRSTTYAPSPSAMPTTRRLAMWHVSNELGCHNVRRLLRRRGLGFPPWLQDRYGDLDSPQRGMGHGVLVAALLRLGPDAAAAASPLPSPTRRSSSTSRGSRPGHCRTTCAPRSPSCARSRPDVPITTNFMVMGGTKGMDYAAWASDVDLVSNDHYLHGRPARRQPRAVLLGQPRPVASRVGAVVPDGALDQRGQLAAGQPAQAAGPAAAGQPGPRRARVRRGELLPVAAVPRRRREVPLRDGSARRHRHPGLARGRSRSAPTWRARRGRRVTEPSRPRSPSSSTGTRGGPASSTRTPPPVPLPRQRPRVVRRRSTTSASASTCSRCTPT